MALEKCPECGADVSAAGRRCPRCDCPLRPGWYGWRSRDDMEDHHYWASYWASMAILGWTALGLAYLAIKVLGWLLSL